MAKLITLNTKIDGSFDNYFEDTMIIPARSEVALIKTMGLNVRFNSYEFITVPGIQDADRTIQMFRFGCDGVNVALTWIQLYNKYDSLVTSSVTETEFFSGKFRWSLNPEDKGNCVQCFAECLSDLFLFYKIEPNCDISKEVSLQGFACNTKFGFSSQYSTEKRLKPSNLPSYLQDIGNLNVYEGTATVEPGKITTTQANTIVYSTTDIAVNGGVLTFNIEKGVEGTIGLILEVIDEDNIVGGGAHAGTIEIDFGIKNKANGDGTYSIIRNGNIESKPFGYTADSEDFAFVITRANNPETLAQSEYTIYLLQGYPFSSGSGSAGDYQNYAVATYNMNGGYSPTFVCDIVSDNAVIDEIQVIPAEGQDLECRIFMDRALQPNDLGSSGTIFRNSHSYILRNSSAMTGFGRENTRSFFQNLGLETFTSSVAATSNNQLENHSNPNNNRLIIPTKVNGNIEIERVIWAEKYGNTLVRQEISLPSSSIVSEVPQPFPYLQFHIETLNCISFEGNFVKQSRSRQQNTATKVLMNIPRGEVTPIISNKLRNTTNYINYDYEAFNPYYVSLNNPEPLHINQLKGRLSTPDNTIVTLDVEDGVANSVVMLHIRKELATTD